MGNYMKDSTPPPARLKLHAHHSESLYKALIQQAAGALFIHDFEGRFIEVNQHASTLLGYSREELLQMGVADVSPDFDLADSRAAWKELETGKSCCMASTHRRKDGSSFPVEVRLAPLTIDNHNLVMALASDITERKRVEDKLRKSEELLRESQTIAGLGSYRAGYPHRALGKLGDPESGIWN